MGYTGRIIEVLSRGLPFSYPRWLSAIFRRFSETTCFVAALLLICSYVAGGTFAFGLIRLIGGLFATPMTSWEPVALIAFMLCLFVLAAIGFVCSMLQAFSIRPKYGFLKRAMSFFAAIVLLYVGGASFLSFFDTTINWHEPFSYVQIVFVTIELCIGMALIVLPFAPQVDIEIAGLETWFEELLSLPKTAVVALIVVTTYALGHNSGWPEYITFQTSLLLALAAAAIVSSIQRRKGTA